MRAAGHCQLAAPETPPSLESSLAPRHATVVRAAPAQRATAHARWRQGPIVHFTDRGAAGSGSGLDAACGLSAACAASTSLAGRFESALACAALVPAGADTTGLAGLSVARSARRILRIVIHSSPLFVDADRLIAPSQTTRSRSPVAHPLARPRDSSPRRRACRRLARTTCHWRSSPTRSSGRRRGPVRLGRQRRPLLHRRIRASR